MIGLVFGWVNSSGKAYIIRVHQCRGEASYEDNVMPDTLLKTVCRIGGAPYVCRICGTKKLSD